VLLSAAGGLDKEAKTLCAAGFVAKPFDIDHVISAIEGAC
jgi:hypothetical protein